jgi:drug/metabolite transporter (DMT)-like permease
LSMFTVLFVVVFIVGTLLQFLGLEPYTPTVAGVLAGGVSVALNLILSRRLKEPTDTVFQIIWIGSFAAAMFFFVLQHAYSQDYLPRSLETWLFFLFGWSFVVIAAIIASFYMKRRTLAN